MFDDVPLHGEQQTNKTKDEILPLISELFSWERASWASDSVTNWTKPIPRDSSLPFFFTITVRTTGPTWKEGLQITAEEKKKKEIEFCSVIRCA
jgi:hypothetical protein